MSRTHGYLQSYTNCSFIVSRHAQIDEKDSLRPGKRIYLRIFSELPGLPSNIFCYPEDSGTMEKKKGRLSEKALKSNGIEFDEKVERSMGRISEYFLREDSRSQQAWIVTEGLLDFDGILSPHNVVSFITC